MYSLHRPYSDYNQLRVQGLHQNIWINAQIIGLQIIVSHYIVHGHDLEHCTQITGHASTGFILINNFNYI